MLIFSGNNINVEMISEYTRVTNLWNTNNYSIMIQLEICYGKPILLILTHYIGFYVCKFYSCAYKYVIFCFT